MSIPPAGGTVDSDTRVLSVLWIDDESSVITPAIAVMARYGIHITGATMARAGLELAASQPWDAILLDYQMPGMSGIELLAVLRREGVTTPVIVLTAHATDDLRFLAERLGATRFYQKPLVGRALAEAIGEAIDAGPAHPDAECIEQVRRLLVQLDALGRDRMSVERQLAAARQALGYSHLRGRIH